MTDPGGIHRGGDGLAVAETERGDLAEDVRRDLGERCSERAGRVEVTRHCRGTETLDRLGRINHPRRFRRRRAADRDPPGFDQLAGLATAVSHAPPDELGVETPARREEAGHREIRTHYLGPGSPNRSARRTRR